MKKLNLEQDSTSINISLRDGTEQKVHVVTDQKVIAIAKFDNTMCVNNKFLKLPVDEQEVIIYHERGHLNFVLWKYSGYLRAGLLTASVFSVLFPLLTLLNVSFPIWIFLLGGSIFFISFIAVYWLLEVIADANAVKHVGKEKIIKTIEKQYLSKKPNFIADNIFHPPWKLRKRIMEELD